MGLYEDWLAEQGVSQTGTGQMPWYEGEHSFGTELLSEGGDPLQGYGMSDIWNMYQGIQHLYGLQDVGDYQGTPWHQAMAPEAYNVQQSGERLLREAYAEDFKGYKLGQQDLKQAYTGKMTAAGAKIGKAGFAGGGSASKSIGTEQAKYTASSRGQQEGWAATNIGYQKDILGARKNYIEDLWSKYSIFTSGLTEAEVAPEDPTGQYDSGWDWWSATYG